MRPLPRQIKRHLNRLVGQAYENELSQALEKLAAQVDEWRAGRIGAGELAQWIHEYDTGPLREMFKRYNSGYHELQIASALQEGYLQENDVPQEVWPYLQNAIAFIEDSLGGEDVDDD